MKARKKPIVIDVWPMAVDAARHAPKWVLEAFNRRDIGLRTDGGGLYVQTLEGTMMAEFGDMLMKGPAGELYPCKRAIFDATYELVPE